MENIYDAVIVGGGPAGLTAALYLARAKYRVVVLEKGRFGGQIVITNEVVNYPGIEKTSGEALTDTMKKQAEAFGAELVSAEATGFDFSGDIKTVHTTAGDYRCLGVLLAPGANPRAVGFEGEEQFKGRGVAYCATCDGEFFTGKEIFVVGGGYAAAEESVFLTKFARHVTILIRKDDFSCAASVAEPAKQHEKITILTNTVLEAVSGENALTYARYKNTVTGEVTQYKSQEPFGVFVLAGYSPATDMMKGTVELDAHGYIVTDQHQKTSIDGVYAAGDVCYKPLRQVVTATSDGALAATELEKYIAAMQKKTGVYPKITKKAQTASDALGHAEADRQDTFSDDMRQQLQSLFSKMARPILLKLYLDSRPVCTELEALMHALASLTDKLTVTVAERDTASDTAPCVEVCLQDGTPTGIAFHGVPSGHEFTGFILSIYNAAGPGQALEAEIKQKIDAITKPVDMKILVTLSCTMCPELVIAAQKIAAENPLVTAHVYDIRHFDKLQKQYNVMSVPCLVVNDTQVSFGKKNISELLSLL